MGKAVTPSESATRPAEETERAAVGPRELAHIRAAINACFGGMGKGSAIWSNNPWDKGHTAGVLAALTAFDHAVKYPPTPSPAANTCGATVGPQTKIYYSVSFDFEDDNENANSQDFRDLLMEKFEQAVLEGRMTNVKVALDHRRMVAATCGDPKEEL